MNNPSYPSASVFPLLQTGMMNVYLDIELFFQYLNQEFNNRGSLRFERMKASFIQQSSDIATTAHRLAAQVFIPIHSSFHCRGKRPSGALIPSIGTI